MKLFLIIVLSIFFQANAVAQTVEKGITVVNVTTQQDDRIYYMDAVIETHLPDYIIQAIYNGVPLPLLLQIEVIEPKNWWPDTTLVTIEQRYVLHYYPLLDSIRFNNLTNGSSRTVKKLEAALQKIGVIKHFPLLDKEHFPESKELYARIRLKIDENALPKPLRAESMLGGNWDLASDWKEWVL